MTRNARIHVPVPIKTVLQSGIYHTTFSAADHLPTFSNHGTAFDIKTKEPESTKSVTANEINPLVESHLLLVGDSVDDFCQVNVAETILKHSNEVYKVLEQIHIANKNRSFNVFDVPLLQMKGLQNLICGNERSDVQLVDEMVKQETLSRNLSGLGLEVDVIEGDGNCCFMSIVQQVSNLILVSNLITSIKSDKG